MLMPMIEILRYQENKSTQGKVKQHSKRTVA